MNDKKIDNSLGRLENFLDGLLFRCQASCSKINPKCICFFLFVESLKGEMMVTYLQLRYSKQNATGPRQIQVSGGGADFFKCRRK